MTTFTAPTSLLDPTGKTDVSDKLSAWLNNVPDGASVNDMTRAVIPPGTYLVEGGLAGAVTLGAMNCISIEAPGATFVQRLKKPFRVQADPSNPTANPAGKWNVVYIPTNAVKLSMDGWLNKASAQDRITDKCWKLNRSRSVFRLNKCNRTRLLGLKVVGGSGTDNVFDADYEAQNIVTNYGCRDLELDDCDLGESFGNVIECNAYYENDGSYTAPIGLWAHDSGFHDADRQIMSLSYGGRFTVERCDLGGSGRSLIDMEPTTDRNDPSFSATVDGVYVLSCNIGKHRLGMMAAGLTHGDVRAIRVAGCRGIGIGTSGTMYARAVIFEDCTDTDTDSSPNACKFAMGPAWGARNVIVRRMKNFYLSESLVKFHEGDGGAQNYSVSDNDCRGRGATSAPVPQFIDYQQPPWSGKFVPFSLPTPAHALRDL